MREKPIEDIALAAQPTWSDVVPRMFRPLYAGGDGAARRPYLADGTESTFVPKVIPLALMASTVTK
jgi:hypothetical protein